MQPLAGPNTCQARCRLQWAAVASAAPLMPGFLGVRPGCCYWLLCGHSLTLPPPLAGADGALVTSIKSAIMRDSQVVIFAKPTGELLRCWPRPDGDKWQAFVLKCDVPEAAREDLWRPSGEYFMFSARKDGGMWSVSLRAAASIRAYSIFVGQWQMRSNTARAARVTAANAVDEYRAWLQSQHEGMPA